MLISTLEEAHGAHGASAAAAVAATTTPTTTTTIFVESMDLSTPQIFNKRSREKSSPGNKIKHKIVKIGVGAFSEERKETCLISNVMGAEALATTS